MSTGAERTPGGTKSALKIAVPLGALVAVVFGVTYITQYTPPPEEDAKRVGPQEGGGGEPPLRFFTSARRWDPPLLTEPGYRNHLLLAPSGDPNVPPLSDEERPVRFNFSLPDRVFQGAYEPSQQFARTAQFWFENRNPSQVTMQLKRVSCTACTGGRVAPLPPETARAVLQYGGLAALPVGAVNLFGVGLTQPLGGLAAPADKGGLPWTEHAFGIDGALNENAIFRVPGDAAGDKWAPQWGILELKFTVKGEPGPAKPIETTFATRVDATGQEGMNAFAIGFDVARAFELGRAGIDMGKIDALSGDREFEVLVYSASRGPGSEFGDLDPPIVTVEAPAGVTDPVKFVEVTKVARVPEADLPDVTERLAVERKRLTKVRSAYKMTVAVRPKVGDTRMDIGALDRTVWVTAGGMTAQLPVKAVVRGGAWIEGDRTEFDVPTFRGGEGVVHRVDLITETANTELAVVKYECEKTRLKFELEKQPDRGGRGHYKLKVTVEPGQAFGAFNGVVVLEVKGPTPQRMRIPFRGAGVG